MDRDTLATLDSSFLGVNRILMGSSNTGEYIERRDVAIISCGLPVEELNWGFLKPPCEDVAATAAAVRAHFSERNLPFQLTLRDGASDPCEKELEAHGWRRKPASTPGMALAGFPSSPGPPSGLVVEEVRTASQLVAYRQTAFRGFGYPTSAAHLFLNERLHELSQVRLYSGTFDGEVVATSMVVAADRVAGIYWVATLEGHRGQGYGEALTWEAVAGGRELGCGVASLQASEMGRGVYARMGFEHVLDYAHYLPPDS